MQVLRRPPLSCLTNIALLALLSCTTQTALLNSERIEATFGSYGVEVLEQSSAVRRTNLFSTANGVATCRTYAMVEFHEAHTGSIAQLHQQILKGGSIGATFKQAGWEVTKQTIHVGEIRSVDPAHPIGRLMRLKSPSDLALHAYRLLVHRDEGKQTHYATIVETHHPDYLGSKELRRLFPTNAAALTPAQAAALGSRVLSEK